MTNNETSDFFDGIKLPKSFIDDIDPPSVKNSFDNKKHVIIGISTTNDNNNTKKTREYDGWIIDEYGIVTNEHIYNVPMYTGSHWSDYSRITILRQIQNKTAKLNKIYEQGIDTDVEKQSKICQKIKQLERNIYDLRERLNEFKPV